MLLADVDPQVPRVELARSIGTRIGEELDESGRLGEEPVRRTLEAISELQRPIRGHYVRLFAIATSAVRRAANGAEFAERVAQLLGVPVRVLSGEEEAEMSFRGAVTALAARAGERVGVLDVGGGSSEYAIGAGPEPERVLSCEIGAVRLTEAVPALSGRDGPVAEKTLERARELVQKALAPLRECAAVDRVAFVGGTATTVAAILRGGKRVSLTSPISREDLQRVLLRLTHATLEERKAIPGMKRQRADILAAGVLILDIALELIGHQTATATTADLLVGFLIQERGAAGGHQPVSPSTSARRKYRP